MVKILKGNQVKFLDSPRCCKLLVMRSSTTTTESSTWEGKSFKSKSEDLPVEYSKDISLEGNDLYQDRG